MAPLATERGFTSPLREHLLLSSSKLDEWVEHQKAKIDADFAEYQQSVSEQQSSIDRSVTHLLALQLEGGLTVNDGEGNQSKTSKEMIEKHAQEGGFPANKISQVRRKIDPTSAEG